MRISDALDVTKIKVFLDGEDKPAILAELLTLLLADYSPTDQRAALDALLDREAVASTGVGQGVALPHARLALSNELLIAFGLTQKPVPFEAVDKKPVRIVLLAICPTEKPALQLRFLARASRVFRDADLRQRLTACEDAGAVKAAFAAYEDQHFG